ncbi:Lipid A 3-O-deacylase-related [Fimbriimonadaceae bacterium]
MKNVYFSTPIIIAGGLISNSFGQVQLPENISIRPQTKIGFEYFLTDQAHRDISIGTVYAEQTFRIRKKPWDRISFGWNACLYYASGNSTQVDQPEPGPFSVRTGGFGISAVARLHIFDFRGGTCFADLVPGFAWFTDQFPPKGSRVNGSYRYGLGVRYRLSPGKSIEFGIRKIHISNGGGLVPSNPAYNGTGIFVSFGQRF